MKKLAVVLFNLGGPDDQAAVKPFLFNLFNDRAILSLPQPLRWCLAKLISSRRAPVAREIYENLGGGSPLLANTQAQARALESRLNEDETAKVTGFDSRVFVSMRYWKPFAEDAAIEVKAFAPDRILLLPLYPQFSTTTSASSLRSWQVAAERLGIGAKTDAVCCYPREAGFVEAIAEGLKGLIDKAQGLKAQGHGAPRVLFSAHGLPKKIVARGDPYQWQVEETADAVVERLHLDGLTSSDFEWTVCYQSRVGPLEWIGPSTEDEICRAGAERRPLIVVPIAFVSEHSETLVELDIEYKALAEEKGVPAYFRLPTVDTHPAFIGGLAGAVKTAVESEKALCRIGAGQPCAARWTACPLGNQT